MLAGALHLTRPRNYAGDFDRTRTQIGFLPAILLERLKCPEHFEPQMNRTATSSDELEFVGNLCFRIKRELFPVKLAAFWSCYFGSLWG
ncbi:hypothetical protein A4A49_28650 [Nicotiana attenuata]|uniref:Uncharacterized protein n=1 Tax=Nicotiana attenuata TaxID=49451 RepID=A0A1J6KN82_NICAT|nr:hypothetical protein A4A49_28650 [Nicotiana attenuata]